MLGMKIRTQQGEFDAELDERSDIANAFWLSLPFAKEINMLGSSFYFELPDFTLEVKDEKKTVFEKGDIAYWPGVNALVVMFGPTPLSGEDRKPVWKYGLIKIGRVISDCEELENAGDRRKVFFVKN